MRAESSSASSRVRLAVGSSRMTTLAFLRKARAISTIWRCATPSEVTSAQGGGTVPAWLPRPRKRSPRRVRIIRPLHGKWRRRSRPSRLEVITGWVFPVWPQRPSPPCPLSLILTTHSAVPRKAPRRPGSGRSRHRPRLGTLARAMAFPAYPKGGFRLLHGHVEPIRVADPERHRPRPLGHQDGGFHAGLGGGPWSGGPRAFSPGSSAARPSIALLNRRPEFLMPGGKGKSITILPRTGHRRMHRSGSEFGNRHAPGCPGFPGDHPRPGGVIFLQSRAIGSAQARRAATQSRLARRCWARSGSDWTAGSKGSIETQP